MNKSILTVHASLRLLGCALALALTPCCMTPNHLQRLLALPDYEDAMRCAPVFTTEAMKTIADLESR